MVMTGETVSAAARRIAEHARTHRLAGVSVVLHGGEPLLAGPRRLDQIATALHSALAGACELDLRIHTNGVLLDDAFCEVFATHGIRVGISLDGDRTANDRHRRYADGRSSYEQVVRAIGRLRSGPYHDLYAGLLCTVDVANDPVAVYEALLELKPPRIDFLLPHATWDDPPVRPAGTATPYAEWLIAIFDRWLAGGRPVPIRTFDSIIQTTAGGDSLTEALGLSPSDLAVIETDGSYQQADSLKTAFDGAPATGLSVFSDSLDAVIQHQGIAARQQGLAGLCSTCQACPVVTSCGGGLYAHRYRTGAGFDNPSVYCADLLKLITHVRSQTRLSRAGRVAASRPAHTVPASQFQALAAGFGDASSVARLAEAQRSLRRALLAAVFQTAAATADGALAALDLRTAWNLLTRADQQSPLSLDDVLGHPYVRVWAVRCLEQLASLRTGAAAVPPALASALGHLGAIAAAACIRAGLDGRVTVPVLDGAVHLPTLGRLAVGPASQPAPGAAGDGPWPAAAPGPGAVLTAGLELASVTVESVPGVVTVRTQQGRYQLSRPDLLAGRAGRPGGGSASWQPLRRLTAPGISVTLEDTDPYRHCHQWEAAPRLNDEELAGWQRRFRGAWAEIRAEHRAYAPGLAAGLRVITPLRPAPAGRDVSATARHAFGAVAAALPGDEASLALLLIHEFQHVKMGAMLDLYDLYDRGDARLFHAPWRDDPRPLEGLLQGTYAHIAVTDFWRARRHADGPAAAAAGQRFAHWRTQTAAAIETLAGSGSLTPLGEQFIDAMRHAVARMADPVATAQPGPGK
jgi:uncharacterized protein